METIIYTLTDFQKLIDGLTILDSYDAKTTENQTPPVTFWLIIL